MIDFFEYIEDYLENNLSADKRLGFEEALKEDASLQAALDNFPTAKTLSEGLLELDILETIEGFETAEAAAARNISDDKTAPKVKRLNTRKWAMAASFVGLIGVGYWGLRNAQTKQFDKIWETQYERPYDTTTTKSIDLSTTDDFAAGKYYFSLNDFDKAEQFLDKVLAENQDSDTTSKAQYWLGHVHMNRQEWDLAIKSLKQSREEKAVSSIELIEKIK